MQAARGLEAWRLGSGSGRNSSVGPLGSRLRPSWEPELTWRVSGCPFGCWSGFSESSLVLGEGVLHKETVGNKVGKDSVFRKTHHHSKWTCSRSQLLGGHGGSVQHPKCYSYLPFPLDEAYVSQHSKCGQLIKAPTAVPNTMRHAVAELITKGFSAWPYTTGSRTCKDFPSAKLHMVSEEFRNCKHKRTPTCVQWRPANSEKQISSTADHIKQRVFRKQTNKQTTMSQVLF